MPAVGSWSTTPLVAQGVTGQHTRTAGELVVDLVDAYTTWSSPLVAERLREMSGMLQFHRGQVLVFSHDDAALLEGLAAMIEDALR